MIRTWKWLPHPLLSLSLLIIWLLLVNTVSAGHIVLGAIIGIAVPLFTSPYWPDRPQFRRPLLAAKLILVVIWDIVIANIAVARLILFRRPSSLKPQFLVIPLDARSRYAISILAGIITMTPGTVSSDLDREARTLLVHGLDVEDPEAVIAAIKARYEAPLVEIFG